MLLFSGLLWFTFSFLFQIFILKRFIQKPKIFLLILFYVVSIIFLAIMTVFLSNFFDLSFHYKNFPSIIRALLVALGLAACWVMSYPAIEVESPTISIMLDVYRAGDQGVKIDTIYKNYDDGRLILPRIQDLILEKFICEYQGLISILPKGTKFVGVFITWRKILGRGIGG